MGYTELFYVFLLASAALPSHAHFRKTKPSLSHLDVSDYVFASLVALVAYVTFTQLKDPAVSQYRFYILSICPIAMYVLSKFAGVARPILATIDIYASMGLFIAFANFTVPEFHNLFWVAAAYLALRSFISLPGESGVRFNPSQAVGIVLILFSVELVTWVAVTNQVFDPFDLAYGAIGLVGVVWQDRFRTTTSDHRKRVQRFADYSYIAEHLPERVPTTKELMEEVKAELKVPKAIAPKVLEGIEALIDAQKWLNKEEGRRLIFEATNVNDAVATIKAQLDQGGFHYQKLKKQISYVNTLCFALPDWSLIGGYLHGRDFTDYVREWHNKLFLDEKRREKDDYDAIERAFMAAYKNIETPLMVKLGFVYIDIIIPDNLRTQHHHIVANTGHGKTQLMQSMILDDLMKRDNTIIVMDSQGDLINNIASLSTIPEERIVLIDPTDVDYPLALNLFDIGMDRINKYDRLQRETMLNSIIELYGFVMTSLLGSELTAKQSTAFDFVVELMFHIPQANIKTLRQLFEPGGTKEYHAAIRQLSETGQSFFRNEFDGKEFDATKKQILRRLYTILRNKTFERMFSHPKNKLDLFTEMNSGKVILINTAESLLKGQCATFGRFFLAMILQAVQERRADAPRTYLYVDEADQYFNEHFVEFLVRARKRNFGLIAAHQYLGQLSPQLASAFASNTAIKFVGGVSSQDANVFAKQMRTTPEFIMEQPKGAFAAYYKDIGTMSYEVAFGRMEQQPKRSAEEMTSLKAKMRAKYQVPIAELSDTDSNEGEPDDVLDDGW